MRALLLLALAVGMGTACSGEPVPEDASAYPCADETLARFRKFVDGDGRRDPVLSAQGTREVVHAKRSPPVLLYAWRLDG